MPASEFVVAAPVSKEDVEERRKTTRTVKSSLPSVFEIWLLSMYFVGIHLDQWLFFRHFSGDTEAIPGLSGNKDVSAVVETDRS